MNIKDLRPWRTNLSCWCAASPLTRCSRFSRISTAPSRTSGAVSTMLDAWTGGSAIATPQVDIRERSRSSPSCQAWRGGYRRQRRRGSSDHQRRKEVGARGERKRLSPARAELRQNPAAGALARARSRPPQRRRSRTVCSPLRSRGRPMQRSNAFRCNKRPPESKETPPGGHNQPRRSRGRTLL
jgi:hypothetical protein